MDPNPRNFPILSYVMSKLPQLGFKQAAAAGSPEYDVENPTPRSLSSVSAPSFQILDHMPRLTDPKVLAAMTRAVSDVAQTRSVLQMLGERPDHESVDKAKAKIVEIESNLSKQLEEIVLSPRPSDVDRLQWRSQLADKEKDSRDAAEKEIQMCKAVIQLDEMHEAYEKLLKEAETNLEEIYHSAMTAMTETNDVAPEGDLKPDDDRDVIEEDAPVNEEVVGILQEALGNGLERVDLSDRQLKHLPEAFGRIRGLVVLNLSTNLLEVIPDSIAGLTNLEELNLSANSLESLPDSIGMLLNLKILNVSANKLSTLPDSICHCRSLVELDASFNKLTYLPTNIGYELVNLKRLSIQLNKIRSLPTSICEMTSLCHLDAHFNEIRGLPLGIGRLTCLEYLNLSSNFNDLTELPDTFGDLINLKELDLSNNQISALPDTFGRLDNLIKLDLDQNPIVIPPLEIVKKGVEAVKEYMAKRWLDILVEEERKSTLEMQEHTQPAGWLTRSSSWLSNVVSGVSGNVAGYLSPGATTPRDPFLDRQL